MFDAERIARYLAGELSPAEHTAFEQDIANDPEALAELAAQSSIDAGLRSLLTPDTQRVEAAIMATVRSEPEDAAIDHVLADTVRAPRPLPLRPTWRWRRLFWPAAIGTAAVLAAMALLVWNRIAPGDVSEIADASEPGIARLTHGTEVVWESDADEEIGAPLSPGRLRLKSGTVEIEFASGAQAILEGPAELRLISPLEAELNFGKLSAQVPESAHGFSVTAGATRVVDLGTAFGVSKPSAGPVEVHVFTGKVEVVSAGIPAQRALTQGEAIRVGPGGNSDLPANRGEFVTDSELRRKEAAELQARYEAWQKAAAAFDADPALLVHFNFEHHAAQANRLVNRVPSAAAAGAAITGCDWAGGRWPGKGALEFNGRHDRVRLQIPGALTSLTYIAWIRIDNLARPNNALAMSQHFQAGDVHWQILHGGALQLSVKTSNGGDGDGWEVVESRRLLTSKWYGAWVQVAAVYDAPGKSMALYLNGKRIAIKAINHPVPLELKDLELGNWEPLLYPAPDRATRRDRQRPSFGFREFSGRFDEFVLLSRPLSAAEIKNLYDAGKPRGTTAIIAGR